MVSFTNINVAIDVINKITNLKFSPIQISNFCFKSWMSEVDQFRGRRSFPDWTKIHFPADFRPLRRRIGPGRIQSRRVYLSDDRIRRQPDSDELPPQQLLEDARPPHLVRNPHREMKSPTRRVPDGATSFDRTPFGRLTLWLKCKDLSTNQLSTKWHGHYCVNGLSKWRHDTQNNDIQMNDTQHKNYETQHTNTQHNDTRKKVLLYWVAWFVLFLCWVLLCWMSPYTECRVA